MGETSPLDGMLVYREVSLQRDMLPGQFSCITLTRNALWKLSVRMKPGPQEADSNTLTT